MSVNMSSMVGPDVSTALNCRLNLLKRASAFTNSRGTSIRSITYIDALKSLGGQRGSTKTLKGFTRLTNGKSEARASDVT